MKSTVFKETLALGFTIFALFFGAGNLIFPPYLGLLTAESWWVGFIAFVVMDVVLSILTLYLIAKSKNGVYTLLEPLGVKISNVFLFTITICIGPLIAIPRTAATTFEMGLQPLFPDIDGTLSMIAFFVLVAFFAINPGKIVAIVGLLMTPLLLIPLMFMIIIAILHPIGVIEKAMPFAQSIETGISSGYQTLDAMAALLFASVPLHFFSKKTYGAEQQKSIILRSSLVASVLLIIVYGGLCYLGATASTLFSSDLRQTQLVVALSQTIFDENGKSVVSIAITMACLTTAIGLTSSCSHYICMIFKNNISYNFLVIFFCIMSGLLASLGVSAIIALAAPIVYMLYPLLITLVIFEVCKMKYIIHNTTIIYSFICVFAFSVLTTMNNYTLTYNLSFIPLSDIGLSWLWAMGLGVLCSAMCKAKKAES